MSIGRVVVGFGTMLALMGATCSPSEPGCEHAGACSSIDPVEARSCINFCVPLWSAELGPNERCALDLCDDSAYGDGAFLCPDDFACTPVDMEIEVDPRFGRCRPTGARFGQACDPGLGPDARPCSTGTVCLDRSVCPEADAYAELLDVSASEVSGLCLLPAREGERCDGEGAQPGPCAPCEVGTYCLPVDGVPRCVRGCERDGEEAPDLCACNASTCEQLGTPMDGVPAFICTPPRLANNIGDCSEYPYCCDELEGAECEEVPGVLGPRMVCCRDQGEECEVDSQCCGGEARCVNGTCVACGQPGQPVTTAGCCAGGGPTEPFYGSVVIDEICQPCDALIGDCVGSHYVQFEMPERDPLTFAVPNGANRGGGYLELYGVYGESPIDAVRYSLTERHRLFLMQGNLTAAFNRTPADHDWMPQHGSAYPTAGVAPGAQYVQFPDADGAVREIRFDEIDTDPNGWTSFRVYDAGSCSVFQPWGPPSQYALPIAVTAELNKGFTDLSNSGPVYWLSTEIGPILAMAGGPFSRTVDTDQVNIKFEYHSPDGTAGCPDAHFRINAGVRFREVPAVLPTAATGRADRVATRPPFNCRIAYDQYVDCEQSPPGGPARPGVAFATDMVDIPADVPFVVGGIRDCAAGEIFNGMLRGAITQTLANNAGELVRALSGDIRVSATSLGMPLESLTDCRDTDAVGAPFPNHGMCSVLPGSAPVAGVRRRRCEMWTSDGEVTEDVMAAAQFRCSSLEIVSRRLLIRPDGIEIVLASSTSDPQHALVQSVAPGVCDLVRPGSLESGEQPTPTTDIPLMSVDSLAGNVLFGSTGRICDSDDTVINPDGSLTTCVETFSCAAAGFRCDAAVPGLQPDAAPDARCYFAEQCCSPDSFCPVPAAGGGRVFRSGDVPRACVDLEFNEFACGSCGTACDPGDICCGGECFDPDSTEWHCGECFNTCFFGYCSDGMCCDSGATNCDGVCRELATDPMHCGACGNVCPSGICAGGLCQ